MPISGKFYTSQELQTLLGVSKQRISNLAKDQGWNDDAACPGIYWAEQVEPYLLSRNIDPVTLPVISWQYPEGITWEEEQRLYEAVPLDGSP